MISNKEQFHKELDKLNKRMGKIRLVIAQRLGREFEHRLKNKIPDKDEYLDYKESIDVKQVEPDSVMKKNNVDAVAITATTRQTVLGDLDTERTVLRFEYSGGALRGSNVIAGILVGYGPWAIDMVPDFSKIPVMAYYMSVSPSEVIAVRKKNIETLSQITDELSKKGVKIEVGTARDDSVVYLDVAFKARRMELGIVGEPMIPHWRRTYKEVRFFTNKIIADVLRESESRELIPEDMEEITIQEIKTREFMKFWKLVTQ